MKKTLNEEKKRILSIMERIGDVSWPGMSILGGMHNMSIEHIKHIRNTIASGLSDDEFRKLIMDALDTVLSDGNELEDPIDSNINAVDNESSDNIMGEQSDNGEIDYDKLTEFKYKLEELVNDYVNMPGIGVNGVLEGMEDVMSNLTEPEISDNF
ncbi:MAG TPA: hypothetical protein PK698_01735 [Bacilli bacterium]|jgi:hypothetical protein|nr:hypothetical protein [Bacilli bacterium]